MPLTTGLIILSLLIADGVSNAQDFPCEAAIQEVMLQHGQFLNTFKDLQVQPYYWSDDIGRQVSRWRLSGTPPQCSGDTVGSIVAAFWADCSVTDIYTTGNCRIPGIRSSDY
jgi:hypothetical protein